MQWFGICRECNRAEKINEQLRNQNVELSALVKKHESTIKQQATTISTSQRTMAEMRKTINELSAKPVKLGIEIPEVKE